MKQDAASFEAPTVTELKVILGRIRTPKRLDDHPWAQSKTVREAVKSIPSLAAKSAGEQLVHTLAELFRQLKPTTPPHSGERLDARWGRFGILAANYFAPVLFGKRYPRTLLEAWRRIDEAILLFVHAKTAEALTPEQVKTYRLSRGEKANPPSATISDWHRQGIEELAGLIATCEKTLGGTLPTVEAKPAKPVRAPIKGWVWMAAAALVVVVVMASLILPAVKGFRVYGRVQAVRADVAKLQGLQSAALDANTLNQLAAGLDQTSKDLASLKAETGPWLRLAPGLGWIPVFGGDLAAAPDLIEVASDGTEAAQETLVIAAPIWNRIRSGSEMKAEELTQMLVDTRPNLDQAKAVLSRAQAARAKIDTGRLSPATRATVERLDPYLSLLDQSLSLAEAVPTLLGGTESGPKTYLILVQNEDELRATGGFVTAVGTIVMWNGKPISTIIDDSYTVDDKNQAYPAAPWQLQQFMNIPIMQFQDVSWFSDYPTAALWAEYLFGYTNASTVDGVIAVDQNFMAALLSVTGPVDVPALGVTVTAENLRTVMRAQKVPPPLEQRDPDWHRKKFMNPIASAILQRLIAGHDVSWDALIRTMIGQLDQKHMLVQVDDPALSMVLAARGWDGAVRSTGGDFLMVVDSNVGYNKTNAVVTPSIQYDVNLADLKSPTSSLVVGYTNNAVGGAGPCEERPENVDPASVERWYPIDRCYYDYVRVYVPQGAAYVQGSVPSITRDEMEMLEEDVPARVDPLDEGISGVEGFGMLLDVPMGGMTQAALEYKLPQGVTQAGTTPGEQIYRLKVQKQPGSQATVLTLRVHLASGARVESANHPFVQAGSDLLFTLDLRTDEEIEIRFVP